MDIQATITGTLSVPDDVIAKLIAGGQEVPAPVLPSTPVLTVLPAPVATAPVAVPASVSMAELVYQPMLGSDYPFNKPVSDAPIETRSLLSVGAGAGFDGKFEPKSINDVWHQEFDAQYIDFGSGIPFSVVNSSKNPELLMAVGFTEDYSQWAVAGVPVRYVQHIPMMGLPIEGGGTVGKPDVNNLGQDTHVLLLDEATETLWEVYAYNAATGNAISVAQCNPRGPWKLPPPGTNSSTADGCMRLPTMLKGEEIRRGDILHALAMSFSDSRLNANGGGFVSPACHASGRSWSSMAVMGQRARLRKSFVCPAVASVHAQRVIRCMQTFGIHNGDNGRGGVVLTDTDPLFATLRDELVSFGLKMSDLELLNTGDLIDETGQPIH